MPAWMGGLEKAWERYPYEIYFLCAHQANPRLFGIILGADPQKRFRHRAIQVRNNILIA